MTIATEAPGSELHDEPIRSVAETEAGEATPAADASAHDRLRMDRVFRAQKAHRVAMAGTTASERRERIRRIERWVKGHEKEIRKAGWKDFRKPAMEVDVTEIFPVLQEAHHAMRDVKRWMKPKKVGRTLALASTKAWVRYEPRGTALIISPWNYPLNLTLCPLISALAAGCTAMLKPSEMTPHTSALMAEMVGELFDEDEVALFEGEADVAQALLAKPFDHVFFTGSPAIGKLVMKAAAEHLTTVTLELGGKSPVIVDRTAHLDDAAKKIVWGKFLNQGQTCIAPDYVLVHSEVRARLLDTLSKTLDTCYGKTSDKRQGSDDLARIVNDRHFQRLRSLLDDSVAAGARVVYGGTYDPDDRWIEPTVLADAPEDSPAMTEEIFGPILPVQSYDDLDEALERVRSREKPLALYLFTADGDVTDQVLGETSSGGACVNDVALHFIHGNLPFGGVNHSGHGSSHGYYGFRAFSHERAVLRHHRFSALKLMAPPYGAVAKALSRITVRFLS